MKKELMFLFTFLLISFNTSAKGNDSLKLALKDFKYSLLKVEYICLSKIYNQSSSLNEMDHSEVKNYLLKNRRKFQAILQQTFTDSKFDSLVNESNSITVDEILGIKNSATLNSLEMISNDTKFIVQKTNQIFDNLKTFEDYENTITKFMATETFHREITPKTQRFIFLIDSINNSEVEKYSRIFNKKLRLNNENVSSLRYLLEENKRLMSVTDSISSNWKNTKKYEGEITCFQQFDQFQIDIKNQLTKINSYLFYHRHLENTKRISKEDFEQLIGVKSDTTFIDLRENILSINSNIEEMITEIRNSIEKVQEGADTSDPVIGFIIAEARMRQEYSFADIKLYLLKLSNLLLDAND